MFRSHLIATYFVIGPLAFIPATSAAANTEKETFSKTVDLAPFTHVAYIPTGAGLSSITLKGIKAVKVATKRSSATNLHYCEQQRLAIESAGSMYCPFTRDESAVLAYQVTYTFTAPSMPSDEYGNSSFTFSVYFHPDEIGSNVRQALTSSKLGRTQLSEFFQLTASRQFIHQSVIDQADSTFCDGTYVEANWTRSNPNCQENIVYKEVTSPSPYITVRIDPASRSYARAATTVSH